MLRSPLHLNIPADNTTMDNFRTPLANENVAKLAAEGNYIEQMDCHFVTEHSAGRRYEEEKDNQHLCASDSDAKHFEHD